MKTHPTSELTRVRSFSQFASSTLGRRLPALVGRPIGIRFRPNLTAGRRLYSGSVSGKPVHAATFIRERKIVLDRDLKSDPKELARILIHEIFHFVWVRLSNELRASYTSLLLDERKLHARGELGWSAESRKISLPRGRVIHPRNKWLEYVCESFCDTAAWVYSGVRRHDEFTLARRHRDKRARWFKQTFASREIPI